MQLVQSGEIQIAAIHQIIRARFDCQVVEDVDLVGLAVGDVNEAGDETAQIEQRVQFDCHLGGAKRRSRIHRQTQIDRRGVEVHSERFVGIQRASHRNQMLSNIGIDLPGSRSIRVGQRIARNRRTSKAHVIHIDRTQQTQKCAEAPFHHRRFLGTNKSLEMS